MKKSHAIELRLSFFVAMMVGQHGLTIAYINGKQTAMNENNKRRRGREPDRIAYTETFRAENAIIHVHYLDISDEENERRKKILEKAVVELWKDKIRREREAEKANKQ